MLYIMMYVIASAHDLHNDVCHCPSPCSTKWCMPLPQPMLYIMISAIASAHALHNDVCHCLSPCSIQWCLPLPQPMVPLSISSCSSLYVSPCSPFIYIPMFPLFISPSSALSISPSSPYLYPIFPLIYIPMPSWYWLLPGACLSQLLCGPFVNCDPRSNVKFTHSRLPWLSWEMNMAKLHFEVLFMNHCRPQGSPDMTLAMSLDKVNPSVPF